MDIEMVIRQLSQKRPVFQNEADFQYTLAEEIKKLYSCHVNCEYQVNKNNKNGRLDILVKDGNKKIGIELKYIVNAFNEYVSGQSFSLKNQSAYDYDKYNFFKDIQNMEYLVNHSIVDEGYVVLISNHKSLWESDEKFYRGKLKNDAEFNLKQGRVVNGTMNWQSIKDVKEPIALFGAYNLDWKVYQDFRNQKNGLFKFLILKIENENQSNRTTE